MPLFEFCVPACVRRVLCASCPIAPALQLFKHTHTQTRTQTTHRRTDASAESLMILRTPVFDVTHTQKELRIGMHVRNVAFRSVPFESVPCLLVVHANVVSGQTDRTDQTHGGDSVDAFEFPHWHAVRTESPCANRVVGRRSFRPVCLCFPQRQMRAIRTHSSHWRVGVGCTQFFIVCEKLRARTQNSSAGARCMSNVFAILEVHTKPVHSECIRNRNIHAHTYEIAFVENVHAKYVYCIAQLSSCMQFRNVLLETRTSFNRECARGNVLRVCWLRAESQTTPRSSHSSLVGYVVKRNVNKR